VPLAAITPSSRTANALSCYAPPPLFGPRPARRSPSRATPKADRSSGPIPIKTSACSAEAEPSLRSGATRPCLRTRVRGERRGPERATRGSRLPECCRAICLMA
jgi:hypothetical protein